MTPSRESLDQFAFEAGVIYWRGPAPFFFAPIPEPFGQRIRQVSREASYGWGVIPVEATIGGVVFATSLFPKDGAYLLPIKAAVRKQANVTAGDVVQVEMAILSARR